MKKIRQLILLSAFLILIGGCDKDFVEINTNPFALTTMDPGLLFAGSQRTGGLGGWESESTIIQQFVNHWLSILMLILTISRPDPGVVIQLR
jgi:hypothetical protein